MKAKDLEQGKYYSTVEFGSNGAVLRQRWWYITLREGDNIRVKLVERLMDNFLSFNYTSEIRYSVNFFKDISFTECEKKHFTWAVEDIIKELQAIEL
mgnify:CR=1 FL=1|jgi:hypothetical protein